MSCLCWYPISGIELGASSSANIDIYLYTFGFRICLVLSTRF
jgi:hypothetical protein